METQISDQRKQVIKEFHEYLSELTFKEIFFDIQDRQEPEILLMRLRKMMDFVNYFDHQEGLPQDVGHTILNYMHDLAFNN